MTEPIVFISHSRVKGGNLDPLRAFIATRAPMLQAAKPLTLTFLPYLSEDGRELAIIHLFANADAFDAHLEGVSERSGAATSSSRRSATRSTAGRATRPSR